MSGLGNLIETSRRMAERERGVGTIASHRRADAWEDAAGDAARVRVALDALVATRNGLLAATRAWEAIDAARGTVYGVGDREDRGDLAEQGRAWEAARGRMDAAHDRWLAACVAAGVAAGAEG